MNEIKAFNTTYIYKNSKFSYYNKYVKLVLTSLFTCLASWYNEEKTLIDVQNYKERYPKLSLEFISWLNLYCDCELPGISEFSSYNKKIYGKLETPKVYYQAIVDFISGMTDQFAIEMFNELTAF
jgi:dGTPase